MWRKFWKVVLGEYTEKTSEARLLRDHRIARIIVYPCISACVGMMLSVFEGAVFGFSDIDAYICGALAVLFADWMN